MNLSNTLAYLIVNIFHIYLFFLAYRIFFGESRVGREMEFLAFAGFYAVNSFAFLAVGNPYFNLVTSVGPLVALTFIYSGRPGTKILRALFLCAASMLLESISLSILQLWSIDFKGNIGTVVNMMANMCLFSVEQMYRLAGPGKKEDGLRVEYWLAIIVLPVGSVVITMLVYGGGGYQAGLNLVIVTILIAMNVLAFRLYELLGKYYVSSYEQKMLQQQNEAYAHEIELIQKTDEMTRLLRHDMRNHASALQRLIGREEYGEAMRYLEVFANDISRGSYADTGNPALDSILNYKLSVAETLGVKPIVEVTIPECLAIEPFDVSELLGNLLDNANEALANSQKKELEIRIWMDRGILYFHISNSYEGETQKAVLNGRKVYITRKEDKQRHGLGWQSIIRVVEKYHGMVETDDTGGKFTVDIMLYLT